MTKTKTWGASQEEWDFFSQRLGLTADLLPVVSNSDAPISPYSAMKQKGKTPSLYNKSGAVSGFMGWTKHHSTLEDIEQWRMVSDYGICVQTRYLRAFDIDIEDRALAEKITEEIKDILGVHMPMRYREDSAKRLLVCFVPGEFGKRTIKTPDGMVELLANGQQFIAAGTHPAGARYVWDGLDAPPVEITQEQYEEAADIIEMCYGVAGGSRARSLRREGGGYADSDDTLAFLEEHALVIGYGNEGQAHIECPFASEHTTESSVSSTSYFPAGSRGYDQGHFVCLHAHCAERGDEEFLDAFGVRAADFDVIKPEDIGLETFETGDQPAWERDKIGRPLATLVNVCRALETPHICGGSLHYDTFKDEVIFTTKGVFESENDNRLIVLRKHLEEHYGFRPVGRELMRDCVYTVSRGAQMDSAQAWLESTQWDGVERIKRFVPEYLGGEDREYTQEVGLYIWTAAAGRVLKPGVKADMIPILKGPQGYRKSTAIAAMAPSLGEFCEVDFDKSDDTLAREMRGKLICEIPELRGLRTRAMEAIKAFVARTQENWVPKYKEHATIYERRSVFLATTNDDEFLADSTGNRRWLPFEVLRIADVEAIERDRAQLWAEGKALFEKSGVHYRRAEELARDEHDKYTIKDSWVEDIGDWLYKAEGLDGVSDRPIDREFLSTKEVAWEVFGLEPRAIRRLEDMRISEGLKKHGYVSKRLYVKDHDGKAAKQTRVWSLEISGDKNA